MVSIQVDILPKTNTEDFAGPGSLSVTYAASGASKSEKANRDSLANQADGQDRFLAIDIRGGWLERCLGRPKYTIATPLSRPMVPRSMKESLADCWLCIDMFSVTYLKRAE